MKAANTPPINGKVYTQVETVLDIDQVLEVDQLNGRQGDNWRDVNLQIMQNGKPRNLSNYSVDLMGKDSAGKIKYTNKATINDAANGLVTLKVAAPFYQAEGPYQEAFIRVVDNNGTVVSSISVRMEVIKNSLILTTGESANFAETIDDLFAKANEQMKIVNTGITTAQQTLSSMIALLNQYSQLIAQKKALQSNEENHYSAWQHFDSGLTATDADITHADIDQANINKLTGGAMNSIMNLIKAVPTVKVKPWHQNWTGTNASKPGTQDAMVVQEVDLPGGVSLMACVGNVDYHVDRAWGNAYLNIPGLWGRGSVCLGTTYVEPNSYFQMTGDNKVMITFDAPVQKMVWTSIFIMSINWGAK